MVVCSAQGRIQKFFEGGVLKFSCMDGRRGAWDFLLKNPSKLEKFLKKGRGFDPQNPSLNTPLVLLEVLLIVGYEKDLYQDIFVGA